MIQHPAMLIPWLPALSAVLCALCCTKRKLRPLAAPICIGSIFAAFLISFFTAPTHDQAFTLKLFDWIHAGDFQVGFTYFMDPLTTVMLMVVTGVGTLVAIYAAGYMAGDRGYARFFAGVSLFIFAMTVLVLADNLLLLYLGWEGVGLCSYLLIGFYYKKPTAVAAAKKAFIVNRIGDLGFALGIMLAYYKFDTLQYTSILEQAALMGQADFAVKAIPFLLMVGAFGKSAQFPLHVWLPDAMEGPTPVSALIHAATMVTAGVYMIARLFPLFELSPYALPTVACVGALTALFAATIALCQYDIKRIYAYSTISQLGYMFLGVGVLSTVGGVFHLFTHAFFKALLFLTAGSVMHSLAGQLDLRKMSGLRTKMPVTCWLMFIGCLALAGVPPFAGFYSKDMILAATLEKGLSQHNPLYTLLAVLGLFTAFLTAFYTFRLWFRVFMGPTQYEMGNDHHAPATPAPDNESAPPPTKPGIQVQHHYEPHEVSWLMNGPLVVLAIGALFAGFLGHHWITDMVTHSTAQPTSTAIAHTAQPHTTLFGLELHTAMELISSMLAVAGIALAAYFHWFNREAADRVAARWSGMVRVFHNKYYIDELYDACFVTPLRTLGQLCFVFDRLIVDGLVLAIAWVPRLVGRTIQPAQHGVLQSYGLGMAAGVAVIALLVLMYYP